MLKKVDKKGKMKKKRERDNDLENVSIFFFKETEPAEISTSLFFGSVRCV